MALCAGTMFAAMAAQPADGAVASAKGVAANTYKFTGAVTGTLHDGPNAGCPYGGIDNGGFVELNDLVGSVSGIRSIRYGPGRGAEITFAIDDAAWPLPSDAAMLLRWGGTGC